MQQSKKNLLQSDWFSITSIDIFHVQLLFIFALFQLLDFTVLGILNYIGESNEGTIEKHQPKSTAR